MRASFIKPGFLKTGLVAFAIAAAISLAVVAVGQGVWGVMTMINLKVSPAIPWAAPVMAVILAGLLAYLGGRGWPASTSAARRRLLRWNPMPWRTFGLAVAAGVLGLVAFGGVWIATADLVHIPAGVQPSLRGIPLPTGVALLIMSSLAAPLSEEAAFRGYAMGILEKAWGWAPAAIVGSSLLFAAVHFVQGLDAIKLGLYFGAGVLFATVAWMTNSLYAAMAVHSLGERPRKANDVALMRFALERGRDLEREEGTAAREGRESEQVRACQPQPAARLDDLSESSSGQRPDVHA